MLRRVRLTLVVLSLVLCLASMVVWVRSYYTADTVVMPRPGYGLGVRSSHGRISADLKWTNRLSTPVSSEWIHSPVSFNQIFFDSDALLTPAAEGWNWITLRYNDPSFRWEWAQAPLPGGFRIADGGATLIAGTAGARPTVGDDYLRIRFPHWLAVCLFGLAPAVAGARFALTHWRRYRRLLAGRCPRCAYDLRATPGRCPECGWSFDAPRQPGKNLPPAPVAERQTLGT